MGLCPYDHLAVPDVCGKRVMQSARRAWHPAVPLRLPRRYVALRPGRLVTGPKGLLSLRHAGY